MAAQAVPLYSMQGTSAHPGLLAYRFFPQRCSDTIRWLIVYVMLSRLRPLAVLKSVNSTKQIRDIIGTSSGTRTRSLARTPLSDHSSDAEPVFTWSHSPTGLHIRTADDKRLWFAVTVRGCAGILTLCMSEAVF